jgi:uncharacterized protein (TIGR03000 family)
MRKVLMIAALAATAVLLEGGIASACGGRRGGCGGGRVGRCHGGRRAHCGGRGCGGGCGGYVQGCGGCAYGGYGSGGFCLATDTVDSGLTATVMVELPADATLTIDGEATSSTSATRVFQTPDLEPGQTFHYTLRAQVECDGQVQTVTRRVEVRAGEQTRVSLPLPATAVAAR